MLNYNIQIVNEIIMYANIFNKLCYGTYVNSVELMQGLEELVKKG